METNNLLNVLNNVIVAEIKKEDLSSQEKAIRSAEKVFYFIGDNEPVHFEKNEWQMINRVGKRIINDGGHEIEEFSSVEEKNEKSFHAVTGYSENEFKVVGKDSTRTDNHYHHLLEMDSFLLESKENIYRGRFKEYFIKFRIYKSGQPKKIYVLSIGHKEQFNDKIASLINGHIEIVFTFVDDTMATVRSLSTYSTSSKEFDYKFIGINKLTGNALDFFNFIHDNVPPGKERDFVLNDAIDNVQYRNYMTEKKRGKKIVKEDYSKYLGPEKLSEKELQEKLPVFQRFDMDEVHTYFLHHMKPGEKGRSKKFIFSKAKTEFPIVIKEKGEHLRSEEQKIEHMKRSIESFVKLPIGRMSKENGEDVIKIKDKTIPLSSLKKINSKTVHADYNVPPVEISLYSYRENGGGFILEVKILDHSMNPKEILNFFSRDKNVFSKLANLLFEGTTILEFDFNDGSTVIYKMSGKNSGYTLANKPTGTALKFAFYVDSVVGVEGTETKSKFLDNYFSV